MEEGRFGRTVANNAIKWSLNLLIDFSASLVRCMFFGMSWSPSLCCGELVVFDVNSWVCSYVSLMHVEFCGSG